MRRGFTLLELTGVLTLLALAASLSFLMGRSVRDRVAVTGAREELVGLITWARAEALRRGSSSLSVVQNPTEIRSEASGDLLHRVDLGARSRLEVVVSGG